MRLAISKPARQRQGLRSRRRRREETAGPVHARPAGPEPAAAAPERRGEEREREAGGPQDRALYVCRCGSAFQAVVTASVRCPHCGDPQAW